MNRYHLQIAAALLYVIAPVAYFLFDYWDDRRPKVGPVGNGPQPLSSFEILCIAGYFLLGVLMLIAAINEYRKYRNESKDKDAE